MPGRDEQEVWRGFREPIARAVGCVDIAARLVERVFPNGVRLLASSGRVSLEDVILFGFDDLGIAPAHGDARRIVTEIRDRHKLFRSWG